MIWWILSVSQPALAADEPCAGHVFEQRVDSENFWVEWEGDTLTIEQAGSIAAYAERSRIVFLEMGWPLTDEPIVYGVRPSEGSGIGGLAQTFECDGVPVPRIELYLGEYGEGRALNVTAHELGHATQYGYMGAYLDSVESWLWWMEGTATWLAAQVDGDLDRVAVDAAAYLDNPQLGLHNGIAAFLEPDRSAHMYGTAVLARYIEERHGGPDAVRDLWEYGGPLTGEPIYLPDALAANGIDVDSFWAEWLARATVLDLEWGAELDVTAARLQTVDSLPAEGEVEEEHAPEGFGFTSIAFTTERNMQRALSVQFEGDPSVDWTVVLAQARSSSPGSQILDYVPLDVTDGSAEGWLSGFERRTVAFLVASPHSPATEPFEFSWSAETIRDPGPMEGTIVLSTDEELAGCGCAAAGRSGAPALLALAVLLVVRRCRCS